MSILLDVLWHQILLVACVTRFPLVGFLSRKSRVWKFDGTQIHAGRPKGQRMESVLALNAFNTHSLGLRDADSNDITFHSMALFKSILIFKYFYNYWVNFNSSVFSLLFSPKKTEWALEVLPRLLRILGSPGQPGARRALFTLSCLELKPRLRAHGFANCGTRSFFDVFCANFDRYRPAKLLHFHRKKIHFSILFMHFHRNDRNAAESLDVSLTFIFSYLFIISMHCDSCDSCDLVLPRHQCLELCRSLCVGVPQAQRTEGQKDRRTQMKMFFLKIKKYQKLQNKKRWKTFDSFMFFFEF